MCIRDRMKSFLYIQVDEAISEGYRTFITGLARGVDMWGAMYVMSIGIKHPELGLKVVAVSPFKEESRRRRGMELWDYNNLVAEADECIFLSEKYHAGCYYVRNRFMVDHSSMILGLIYDKRSGTGYTINYAKKQGLASKVVDVNSLAGILRFDNTGK